MRASRWAGGWRWTEYIFSVPLTMRASIRYRGYRLIKKPPFWIHNVSLEVKSKNCRGGGDVKDPLCLKQDADLECGLTKKQMSLQISVTQARLRPLPSTCGIVTTQRNTIWAKHHPLHLLACYSLIQVDLTTSPSFTTASAVEFNLVLRQTHYFCPLPL